MPQILNQPISPNNGNQVDIELLMGAPLIAASKANITMATDQTRFLLDYCFSHKKDDTYEPIMISMVLTRSVIDTENPPAAGKPAKTKTVSVVFAVPMLTMVPLNSLAVNNVHIEFNMEILSSSIRHTESAASSKAAGTNNRAQLFGKISPAQKHNPSTTDKSQSNTSASSSMKVTIDAGPLPLPTGILSIIDLYSKTIQPV